MANKKYLHKVYDLNRVTVNQRVFDGDFEGVLDDTYNSYWSATGTPIFAARNHNHAYPAETLAGCFTLDGAANYITGPRFGQGGLGAVDITFTNDFTIVMDLYKANWNDGRTEYFLCDQDSFIGASGMALSANVSAGNLRAECVVNGTNRTADYALTSITAGFHSIAIQMSNGTLKLYIDGVNVVSNAAGAGTFTSDAGFTPLHFGVKRTFTGGPGYTYTNYSTATFHGIGIYIVALTAAQLDQIWRTRAPITSASLRAQFEFAEGSGGNISSSINGYGGFIWGGTATGWANGTKVTNYSVQVRTATGGSATQGVRMASSKEALITGGQTYIASAWVQAPAGETVNLTVTPIGGGSPSTTSTLATGAWQQIQLPYVTNAAATKIYITIELAAANASVKTFYVDQVAINDGTVAYPYFDQSTPNVGNSVYGFNQTLQINTGTFTTYTYIKTWNDVSSDFSYEQEINNGGSQVTVELARDPENFGERVDVDFGLEVRIYCVDSDTPNGQLIFTGYILDYTTDENANKVTVIINSYGAELNQFVLTSGDSQYAVAPFTGGTQDGGFWGNYFCQTLTPTENITLSKIVLKQYAPGGGTAFLEPLNIVKGDPTLDTFQVVAGGASATLGGSNTILATSTNGGLISGATPRLMEYDLTTPITLQAGTAYYISQLSFQGDNPGYQGGSTSDAGITNSFPPLGKLYFARATFNNASFPIGFSTAFPILYVELWQDDGSTTAEYLSADPSDILKDVMTNYSGQGGNVIFDDSSIASTGTEVTYTFNSVTIYDALQKCLELAPANWYFYIDHATKKLYFRQKGTTADHIFEQGTHFSKVAFEKRSEDMVNTVYFTGGDLGGGVNLFKKYTDNDSVAIYGQRLQNYIDNRVKVADTAAIIAQAIIEQHRFPEIRASIEVIDTYDIELVKPGSIVGFRNYGQGGDYDSMWDTGYWDQMYWDFDAANPSTFEFQIVRLAYKPDGISAVLSTLPPDVNKRIEDINRNLQAQQTINNPTLPDASVISLDT